MVERGALRAAGKSFTQVAGQEIADPISPTPGGGDGAPHNTGLSRGEKQGSGL